RELVARARVAGREVERAPEALAGAREVALLRPRAALRDRRVAGLLEQRGAEAQARVAHAERARRGVVLERPLALLPEQAGGGGALVQLGALLAPRLSRRGQALLERQGPLEVVQALVGLGQEVERLGVVRGGLERRLRVAAGLGGPAVGD